MVLYYHQIRGLKKGIGTGKTKNYPLQSSRRSHPSTLFDNEKDELTIEQG